MPVKTEEGQLQQERWKLLSRIERLLEVPMIILGFIWLILLILELTHGLPSALQKVSVFIWIIFVIDLIVSFIIAPSKPAFIKKNILVIISLFIPAIRVFRVVRILRLFRSMRLVKVLASLNRSMRSLSFTLKRRAFGFIAVFTVFVLFAGAAGMYAFEKDNPRGLDTYGESLWWTIMIILTIGNDYWPQSTEGRILCCLLALYGFAILGYVTATLASLFIGEKPHKEKSDTKELSELQKDIKELKSMVRNLKQE